MDFNELIAKEEHRRQSKDALIIEAELAKIGGLGYRWLSYQFSLENGYEDEKLAEQQHEFLNDLKAAARRLQETMGKSAGVVGADLIGLMTQLFTYVRVRTYTGIWGWTPENPPTHEQLDEKYKEVIKWAQNTTAVKAMREITDEGYTEKEKKEYDEFRFHHHSTIANQLRTVIADYVRGSTMADSDAFRSTMQDTVAFLAMLDEVNKWTAYGLNHVIMSCLRYDYQDDKEILISYQYFDELIKEWLKTGYAVLAEHR